MLPWIILALVAVPLVIIAFVAVRRRESAVHPAGETAADRAEIEREFEAAERYEEQWREEQHKHRDDTPLP